MERLWSAIEQHRQTHQGSYPPSSTALVEAAGMRKGDLVCPETGKSLFYRKPPAGSGKTFMVFHADPKACPCKLMLYSDGSIGKFGK